MHEHARRARYPTSGHAAIGAPGAFGHRSDHVRERRCPRCRAVALGATYGSELQRARLAGSATNSSRQAMGYPADACAASIQRRRTRRLLPSRASDRGRGMWPRAALEAPIRWPRLMRTVVSDHLGGAAGSLFSRTTVQRPPTRITMGRRSGVRLMRARNVVSQSAEIA